MSDFKLVMVSAGFEHGGNVTHRHLDGHSQLLVYPFESQLGNRSFNDFLASVERVQYRYPEFPEGLSAGELYEQIIDEELKTFLRKRNGSKFKDADCQLDEAARIKAFTDFLGTEWPHRRARVIEAFFRSTFAAWTNYYAKPVAGMHYVGYSPAIGIDADRIVRDFPDVRIMHIVRNPFSAYRDTKRRPFPQPLTKYLITWNIYHSTVEMFARMYPKNVRIFRYEDLVENKETFMRDVASFIGVGFEPAMLYPSWNGVEIKESIAPWGTVLKSTRDYNKAVIDELNDAEKAQIVQGTTALARHFKYDEIDYLAPYYRAE
ncbi:MAG: sulfotransferase [Rhodospirillales bacterium]|nr:sulfotransferase [Alphaproteobacteria bacterium]MCB9987190.1 sulfotransferase [Rhodospirillales bacterium]USO07948.1 MAG: sulfotransferase [Rhodospirillales bacterium]